MKKKRKSGGYGTFWQIYTSGILKRTPPILRNK